MDLLHVNAQASSRVETTIAVARTLEVLCFHMVEQNALVVELAHAVVAKGLVQPLLKSLVVVAAMFLGRHGGRRHGEFAEPVQRCDNEEAESDGGDALGTEAEVQM